MVFLPPVPASNPRVGPKAPAACAERHVCFVPNPRASAVTLLSNNMVDATRLLCYKSLFILNVFVGIIGFADMNLAESEVFNEFSFSNITKEVNDRCILVTLRLAKNSGLFSILRRLSHAFKNETRVGIGVLKQSDLSSISWQNSQARDPTEPGEDLAFFPRKAADRTCLLKPSWEKPPKAQHYSGSRTVEELLAFLNSKCETFRQVDGSLSPGGLAREAILGNLYRVPNSLEPSQDSRYGPVNIASTCERIPLPSKEKFFHEYFFRSKPVVITGRKIALGCLTCFTVGVNVCSPLPTLSPGSS